MGSTSTDDATSTASSTRLAKATCVCCDVEVLVDLDDWESKQFPAALCSTCSKGVPDQVVLTIYKVRSELAGAKLAFGNLESRVADLSGRMDLLVEAQQQLEETVFDDQPDGG